MQISLTMRYVIFLSGTLRGYGLTFVNDRFLLTEIREGGEFRDAILLREPFVVDLDEVYPEGVRVVVDFLKFF